MCSARKGWSLVKIINQELLSGERALFKSRDLIACQRERVEDGLSRLKVGVDKYIKRNIIGNL